MGTLRLVSKYLKDLEECMDDGDSKASKEAKLFNSLEHKSVVIEVDNQKMAIFTKATLRAFGEPFMRYSLPCKVDGQGAWDAELDLADSVNYVTEKVLENMGFVRVNFSDYGKKMVNDVNVEIHEVKFKADFVVLDYVNEGEPMINGVVEMVALVDTGASVSVLPYSLYKDLRLGDPRPYQTNLTMADNTQAKAMGEVKNSYVEAFEMEGEDDWQGSFEVGRDEDGNVKYSPVAPSFIDIEDDIERALAMEAYFNPFKNVIVFKKLVDFIGSLPVQLKNLDWGNERYGTYKKVNGDGDSDARFEAVTLSGRKFNRAFKTKTTTRKLSGKFKTEDN
ncbi:retrovirus-related pol polyprotein from transposon TNT 1-94, partial [Tanacetum coccineum]